MTVLDWLIFWPVISIAAIAVWVLCVLAFRKHD